MSNAANIVLFASDAVTDWVADTKYYNNPVDPSSGADGVFADSNGNVIVAMSGSPGFGVHCYSKYAALKHIRLNNGLTVTQGGTYSPDAIFVPYADGTLKAAYTPTFDDPSGVNAWNVFNVFDVDPTDGALTLFAKGRGNGVQYSDGGYTTITHGAGDSSNNFYGCGFTREQGGYEFPYLAKYNSSGTIQWAKYLQPQKATHTGGGVADANFGSQQQMIADSSGNTYVSLRHTTDSSDPPTFTNKVMKFNTSGTQQWVREVNSYCTNIVAADASYIYCLSGNPDCIITALSVSDGSVAWERTISLSGSEFTPLNVHFYNSNLYISAKSRIVSTDTTGMTWVKMSTSGSFDWDLHIYADPVSAASGFSNAKNSFVVGGKMYMTFEGLEGITTVVLPIDASKTGTTHFPHIGFGGSQPFTYNSYQADIIVEDRAVSSATSTNSTSTSSSYSVGTETITTSDVDTFDFGVSYDATAIASMLAPTNDLNPVTAFSKRRIV